MPKGKQYLVTALSVFFSFGAVVSALVAIFVVPGNSCTSSSETCIPDLDNRGWQYLLQILAGIVGVSFLASSSADDESDIDDDDVSIPSYLFPTVRVTSLFGSCWTAARSHCILAKNIRIQW